MVSVLHVSDDHPGRRMRERRYPAKEIAAKVPLDPADYWVELPKPRSHSLKTLNLHFGARKQTGVQARPQIRAIEGPPTR
jgi:hypothetical protein